MPTFTVQKRQQTSAKGNQLRKQGLTPMALVDRAHETILIQAPADQLRRAIQHADGLGRLDLMVDGETKTRKVIVKHIEQDAMRHELIHVTVQEVGEDDLIRVDVPVVAHGTPLAMEAGDLILTAVTDHIKLRARMSAFPEKIEVDVSGLQPEQNISASDVVLPEGVELISSPDATLFTLKRSASSESEADAEATPAEAEGSEADAPEA